MKKNKKEIRYSYTPYLRDIIDEITNINPKKVICITKGSSVGCSVQNLFVNIDELDCKSNDTTTI